MGEWKVKTAQQLLDAAQAAGVFTVGIVSDRRGRGTSINVDLHGWDEAKNLAVIQVRQCQFRPGRHNHVRKDYYLLGRVESGAVFAHAIESPLRKKAAREDRRACVDLVLADIWQCRVVDLPDIERQGDIALIPVVKLPVDAAPVAGPITLRGSHVLDGDIWLAGSGSTYYTRRGARLTHVKGEHATVKARGGYYRVQEGVRATGWGFSSATAD